jgi:hypothetical protein
MMRGRIIAAPTDFPVRQGWLSVEMAVRALEKRLVLTHAGPPILMVKSDTVDQTPVDGSLAPASFVPVCSLEAKEPTNVSPKSRSALCRRLTQPTRRTAAFIDRTFMLGEAELPAHLRQVTLSSWVVPGGLPIY